jgi:hypothetical protein
LVAIYENEKQMTGIIFDESDNAQKDDALKNVINA